MARPIKNNADYFSHDSGMRNNIKVKALRKRFAHVGYAVWCYLLETLTDSDYFEIDYSPLNQELLASDYDVTVEELQSIVEYCIKINLLQLSEDGARLYCIALKDRLSEVIELREKYSRAGKLGMMVRWGKKAQFDNNVITSNNTVITQNNKRYNTLITSDNKLNKTKLNKTKLNNNLPPLELNNSRDKSLSLCNSVPPLGEVATEVAPTHTSKKIFKRPTVSEVEAYCRERGNGVDAQRFYDFYESKGWLVGKSPMKDWKAAVRTWEQKHKIPTEAPFERKYPHSLPMIQNGQRVESNGQKRLDEIFKPMTIAEMEEYYKSPPKSN